MRDLATLIGHMTQMALEDELGCFAAEDIRDEIAEIIAETQPEFRQHPLGFLIADLTGFDRRPSDRVRLHIWPRDVTARSDGRGTRHTHSWDLRSAVVSGRIRNDIYSSVSGGTTKMGRIDYHADGTSVEVVGEVTVELDRSEAYESGDMYTVAGSKIHESVLVEGPAATVVLARDRGLPVYMLMEQDFRPDEKTSRPVVSAAEVMPILRDALSS